MHSTPAHARDAGLAALAAALAILACSACNATSPSALPTLGLGFHARGAYADRTLYRAEIGAGAQRRVVQGSGLTVHTQTADFLSAGVSDIRLGVGEKVPVRVALVLAPGDTAAAGTVTVTTEINFDYGVGAHVGTQRPTGFCFTLAHALPLPARGGTQGDSLFITVAGIPRDAVC